MAPTKKTILVTGGNSGLGFQCCLALAKQPNTHVILASRSQQRVNDAVAEIKTQADATSEVEAGVIDLASLQSVRTFAQSLLDRKLEIFSIVCNGGVQMTSKEMTIDGFESTFGINHLGHFLLVLMLREHTRRVIMLGSETHDPAERTGVPDPNVSDLDQLARGYDKFNPLEAYSTSKLLNMTFAKEFARRYPAGPEILSYSPGLTLDTALFRGQNAIVKLIAPPIIRLYTWFVGGRTSTSAYSGGWMARLASEEPLPVPNNVYVRVDEVWEPSALTKDEKLGSELWTKSLKWVGL